MDERELWKTRGGGRPVFRFAPSPNGRLHLGHAYSALLNQHLAKNSGGRLLLRIEDIDTIRCRPEFTEQIFEDLAWLGVTWEEPVRRQSEHFGDYAKAAAQLSQQGVLYACFAGRSEIEAAAGAEAKRDPDGAVVYPGLWRDPPPGLIEQYKERGEPFAFRLHMDRALAKCSEPVRYHAFTEEGRVAVRRADPGAWGDVVLVRKDTASSYHLSVVADDAIQGVTHIVRGMDLEPAAGLHRLLQHVLRLPEPVYHHHRLLPRTDGRKLSKSLSDQSLAELRRQGVSPSQIRNMVGLAD